MNVPKKGGAQAHIIAADIQAQRDLALALVDEELVEQVAGGQGHFFELGPVPAVEEDAAAARVGHDGVQALAQLVDGLVEHDLALAAFGYFADLGVALGERVGHLGLAVGLGQVDQLVGRPLAPLHAVDGAQVVGLQAVGVGQPGLVFIGVLVPDLAAQRAEIGGAARGAQKTDHLADGGFESQLLGGDGRKALLQIKLEHGAGHAERADACAVGLPGALVQDVLDELEVLLHVLLGLFGGPGRIAARGGRLARRRHARQGGGAGGKAQRMYCTTAALLA